MNLNEAAETVTNDCIAMNSIESSQRYSEACEVLENTMIAELDPTPISEKWLQDDGWYLAYGVWYRGPQDLMRWGNDAWVFFGYQPRIKTLGELRTLLRLAGESGL